MIISQPNTLVKPVGSSKFAMSMKAVVSVTPDAPMKLATRLKPVVAVKSAGSAKPAVSYHFPAGGCELA